VPRKLIAAVAPFHTSLSWGPKGSVTPQASPTNREERTRCAGADSGVFAVQLDDLGPVCIVGIEVALLSLHPDDTGADVRSPCLSLRSSFPKARKS